MLDKELGVLEGRVTGRRVLPSAERPTVEISFEVSGMFAGIGTTWLGTYWAAVRPDGTLYGECPQQGVVMTAAGGMGSWTSAGVGWFGEGGATDFRGALYLMTPPEGLTHLNRTAVVFEWHVDGEGNARGTFWAWT